MLFLLKFRAWLTNSCVVCLKDIDHDITYRIAKIDPFGEFSCQRYAHRRAILKPGGHVSSPSYVVAWEMVADYRKGGQ